MSNTIWKFPLSTTSDTTQLQMPASGAILDIQVLNGDPMLWALVDPMLTKETRCIKGFVTGETFVNTGMKYIKTVTIQEDESLYVVHYFEVLDKEQSRTI